MISKVSIERLKNKIDIVEIINSYIPIKQSGANFKGCCPFHDEKTPSFTVSPSRGMFHCFGCSAGGDAIKFVMDIENLEFIDAIKKIADFYNFELEESDEAGVINTKNLHKPLEILNHYYKKLLPHKKDAIEYLKDRGLSDESIEKFEIGYAPSSSETITFLKKYIDMELAFESGAIAHDRDYYARFIERITFPIYSHNSKIVGFGGRTITNHPAKYINSSQNEIFNKSSLLYGYNLARREIHKRGEVIITEGYLDVIMLHQAGFRNSVATLGTALTNEHLPLLKRDNSKVILAFDGDKAGLNAGLKASKLLAREFIGGVVIFGGLLDPADYVKEGRIDELQRLLKSYKPFLEFILEQMVLEFDLKNPKEKELAFNKSIEFLKDFSNVIQDEYKAFVASLLDIKESFIKFEPKIKERKRQITDDDLRELSLIKTVIEKPSYLDLILDRCDDSLIFKRYGNLMNSIKENNLEDTTIRRILLSESIKSCSENEVQKAINTILIEAYKRDIARVKSSRELSFDKKSFYIRKSQDAILRLKRGELLTYEFLELSS